MTPVRLLGITITTLLRVRRAAPMAQQPLVLHLALMLSETEWTRRLLIDHEAPLLCDILQVVETGLLRLDRLSMNSLLQEIEGL